MNWKNKLGFFIYALKISKFSWLIFTHVLFLFSFCKGRLKEKLANYLNGIILVCKPRRNIKLYHRFFDL
jgi:hypothetical protein